MDYLGLIPEEIIFDLNPRQWLPCQPGPAKILVSVTTPGVMSIQGLGASGLWPSFTLQQEKGTLTVLACISEQRSPSNGYCLPTTLVRVFFLCSASARVSLLFLTHGPEMILYTFQSSLSIWSLVEYGVLSKHRREWGPQ